MGMNRIHLQQIKQKCHNNKIKYISSIEHLRLLLAECTDKKIRLYVDEFLFSTVFCNNYESINAQYPELILNGYFSGSMNSKYSNVITHLHMLNKNECFTMLKGKTEWI